jgi:hypothetical protein
MSELGAAYGTDGSAVSIWEVVWGQAEAHCFGCSVQGVGKSASGALYPGSGETADNRAVQVGP